MTNGRVGSGSRLWEIDRFDIDAQGFEYIFVSVESGVQLICCG
jgi:hypothetical protein